MNAPRVRCFHLAAISLVMVQVLTGCASNHTHEKEITIALTALPATQLSSIDFAVKEMTDAGIAPDFAKKLEAQYLHEKKNTENRDHIIQLNVLGFLTPGDYSKHFSLSAVKHIKIFLRKYKSALTKMEDEFHVPKSIVASLLWVETKHGKTMGDFHLPIIYFTLLQAGHPEVVRNTLLELNHRKPASNSSAVLLTPAELQQKAIQRSLSKAKWALEQIKVLEQLSKQSEPHKNNSRSILTIKSSFAGAFGCSQFIPSSYQKYAVSFTKGKTANLFEMKDCIMSVANFLNKSGWDSQNPKAQSDALFEYNRIHDYGDVIQKLAQAASR